MSNPHVNHDEDLLLDIQQATIRILEAQGMPENDAEIVASKVRLEIHHNWGGQQVYIKKNDAYVLSQRDMKIFNECKGYNHDQLAKKYNLTKQYIYMIVKIVTKAEVAKRQDDLFPEQAKKED